MTQSSHEEALDELAGVALGSAAGGTADRVRRHALSCPECSSEFAKLETTARQLGELIREHPINPGRAAGIRSRLVSRANADTDRRAVTVATSAASRVKPPSVSKTPAAPVTKPREQEPEHFARGSSPGGMAIVTGVAAIIAVGAIIQMLRANSEAASLRATIQVQRDPVEQQKPLDAPVLEQDKIVAGITGADVKVIPLTHYGARGAVGKMFWNRETNTWTLVTYSIRQPKQDKVFQVWLSTSNGTVSGGTFVPDPTGHALVQSTNQVSREGLYSISVTEEAKGGAPAPTGPAVIAGAP